MPQKTVQLPVTDRQLEVIKSHAKGRVNGVSAVIRMALREYFEKHRIFFPIDNPPTAAQQRRRDAADRKARQVDNERGFEICPQCGGWMTIDAPECSGCIEAGGWIENT